MRARQYFSNKIRQARRHLHRQGDSLFHGWRIPASWNAMNYDAVIHCVSPVYTYCIERSQATPLLLIKLPFFFTINARRKCNAFLTSIPRVERRGGGTHRGTGNLYADNSPPPSWGKFPLGERLVARNPHLSSTKCSA